MTNEHDDKGLREAIFGPPPSESLKAIIADAFYERPTIPEPPATPRLTITVQFDHPEPEGDAS
jgi:hypothetical protein